MNDRDYIALFNYFVGAKGNHAVHVRALIHAGFDVESDPDNPRKSYVKNPASRETLGVIVGEPEAVIGKFQPLPPVSVTPEPAPVVKSPVPKKHAGYKSRSSGY